MLMPASQSVSRRVLEGVTDNLNSESRLRLFFNLEAHSECEVEDDRYYSHRKGHGLRTGFKGEKSANPANVRVDEQDAHQHGLSQR